jgi:hypothetical protein
MPKYLAFTKLLSQPVFDEFNLSDYYTWVKDYTAEQHDAIDTNDYVCTYRSDDDIFLFGYNQEQQKLVMRQLDAIPTWGTFHTRSFITDSVDVRRADSKIFLAPELSLFNSRYARAQLENYFTLLVYLMSKFGLSLDELSAIITQSLIETDDVMDVFKIPYTGKMKSNRRQGFFSFINDSTLRSHMNTILDDLNDNKTYILYLSAYFRLCIPSMTFKEIDAFLANIDIMRQRLRNMSTYYLPTELASKYYAIYQVMQDEATEREAFLLQTTVQTITFDTWKHNVDIREQIDKGARVNIMIDMGSEW